MDGRTFMKFLKDSELIASNCTPTDADLIFTKVKPRGGRTLSFDGFMEGLNQVALRKGISWNVVVTHIINRVAGPTTSHTVRAEKVRFHDDKSLYTGVHAQGGPTNIGHGGDGSNNVTLEKLADRSPYDIRGRKIKEQNPEYINAARVRQRRLSSHGHQMLQNVMAAQTPAQKSQPPPPQRAAPAPAGSGRFTGGIGSLGPAYTRGEIEAPQGERNMGTWTARVYTTEQQARLGVDEAGMSQAPQSRQPQPGRPQTAGGGYAARAQAQNQQSRPKTSRGGSPEKKNIFDRLTDTSNYTGMHKARFDSEGRGRGLDGRDPVGKGSVGVQYSHQSTSRTGRFKGNTNTNTDVTYSDLSQFITRR